MPDSGFKCEGGVARLYAVLRPHGQPRPAESFALLDGGNSSYPAPVSLNISPEVMRYLGDGQLVVETVVRPATPEDLRKLRT